jgi:hypothetical protein
MLEICEPVVGMVYEQQIQKLKGHAVAFVDELEWIIQSFAVAEPMIKNKALLDKVIQHKSTMGFRVLRRSVGRYCIIGLTRLTYDKGSKNPTARNLINDLTCLCTGADGLRKQLKVNFARPVRPGVVPGYPPTELDIKLSEEIDQLEVAENQQLFEDYISRLEEHWKWFSEHESKFIEFRNKRVAHLEVTKYEDRYGPTEIEPVEWDLAVEALGRLIQVAGYVSAILENAGSDWNQTLWFAKKDAQDFWQAHE